jgi:hypothetical protein
MMEARPSKTDNTTDLAIAWHKKALTAERPQENTKAAYLERALVYSRRCNLAPGNAGSYGRVRYDFAISLWCSRTVVAGESWLARREQEQRLHRPRIR